MAEEPKTPHEAVKEAFAELDRLENLMRIVRSIKSDPEEDTDG